MVISIQQAIGKVSKHSLQTRDKLNRSVKQRRNSVYNSYGSERQSVGGANTTAKFYVPITPDVSSFVRWEFKLIIKPYILPIAGGGTAITIGDTELTIGETPLTTDTQALEVVDDAGVQKILPDPHQHKIPAHGHTVTPTRHTHAVTVTAGVTLTPPDFTYMKLKIDGLDITDLLKNQFPMPTGEGIFPDDTIGNRYDIIKVCSLLDDTQRNKILSGGMHLIELESDGLFEATISEFLNYSALGRHGDTKNTDFASVAPLRMSITNQAIIKDFGDKELLTLELNDLKDQLKNLTGSKAYIITQTLQINTRIAQINELLDKINQVEEIDG